jgi:hypothetical protein
MNLLLPDHGPWVVPAIGVAACLIAFLLGRRFLAGRSAARPADPDALFKADILGGVTRDRRAAPRRKGNPVEVQLDKGAGDKLIIGYVLNRSVGGLCLLLDEPLPEKALAKIRPKGGSELTPWTDVTVQYCRQDGIQYEAGCQFHHTPNWSLLLQFG